MVGRRRRLCPHTDLRELGESERRVGVRFRCDDCTAVMERRPFADMVRYRQWVPAETWVRLGDTDIMARWEGGFRRVRPMFYGRGDSVLSTVDGRLVRLGQFRVQLGPDRRPPRFAVLCWKTWTYVVGEQPLPAKPFTGDMPSATAADSSAPMWRRRRVFVRLLDDEDMAELDATEAARRG